jgi:hypothetical protein
VAPDLLDPGLRERVARAKRAAATRVAAEKEIPKRLLFSAGWPTAMPTPAEAELLASVRRQVAQAVGIEIGVSTARDVIQRFEELLSLRGTVSADGDGEGSLDPGTAEADLCGAMP